MKDPPEDGVTVSHPLWVVVVVVVGIQLSSVPLE